MSQLGKVRTEDMQFADTLLEGGNRIGLSVQIIGKKKRKGHQDEQRLQIGTGKPVAQHVVEVV